MWFPLFLLVFMVPLPEVSIAQLNFRLKMWAADWGVSIATNLGVIVERQGNRVLLEGDKNLVIANVCNGLRTLISLLAFGSLYAYVCRLRGVWRIALFAMSVPVAVVANSFRIVTLILVADIWDVETATGWYHDTSGVLVFVLAFLLMFGLEKLVLGVRRMVGRPAKILPLFHGALRDENDQDQWVDMKLAGGTRTGLAAAMVMVLSAGGAWWLNRSIPPVWNQEMARKAVPPVLRIGGQEWSSYEQKMDEQTLTVLETRDYMLRRYVRAGGPDIDFCVIFSQDNRKGTHPPDLCLEGGGQDIVAAADVVLGEVPNRGSLRCRELVVQSSTQSQYFLYTYKCGNIYTESFWVQQFIIFTNGLLNRDASGALIRVSTPIRTTVEDARQRSTEFFKVAIPYLDAALP